MFGSSRRCNPTSTDDANSRHVVGCGSPAARAELTVSPISLGVLRRGAFAVAFIVAANALQPTTQGALSFDIEEATIADLQHLQQLAGRAVLRLLAAQPETAKSGGEEARPLLEARLGKQPDDTIAMTGLSWVYLALGRNADALRLSKQAADSMPIEKDAVSGPDFQLGLAQIEARARAPEEAIKRLRYLLSIPAGDVASILF